MEEMTKSELRNQVVEYRIPPSPDAERLIQQIVAKGIPRCVVEPAIVKHDAEASARVAYG